jgi:hypothetical protein
LPEGFLGISAPLLGTEVPSVMLPSDSIILRTLGGLGLINLLFGASPSDLAFGSLGKQILRLRCKDVARTGNELLIGHAFI